MADELSVIIENIGGFREPEEFKLKHGLNVIKAPNSTGKTSLVKAIELMTLNQSDLRNKGHYMNLMADPKREKASIELKNAYSGKRTFRRSDNDLTPIDGEPLFPDGHKVAEVCFATPNNDLINKMLSGDSIQSYIERFSDSNVYGDAISILQQIQSDLDRQHRMYREDLIRLEQEEENLSEEEKLLYDKQEEIDSLPEIDFSKATEDKELTRKIEQKRAEKRGLDDKIHGNRTNKNNLESRIKSYDANIEMFEERMKNIGKDKKRINDELFEIDNKLNEVRNDISKYQSQLTKIDDELSLVNQNFQKRQKYGEEKLCVACGQSLSLKKLQRWENELRDGKNDYQKKLKENKRKKEDLLDEQTRLERDLQDLSNVQNELKSAQKSKANTERKLSSIKEKIVELTERRDELEGEIEKLVSTVDENLVEVYHKRNRILDQLDDIKARIDSRRHRIEELEEKTRKADEIVREINFVEDANKYMRKRKEKIVEAVREKFNERIMDVYEKLGFENFDEIEISRDYKVYIKRPGYFDPWPLEALSTSEQITLAVMLLITGKQQYMPEYPFFVLDELVTSYDPTRFETLKHYISDVTEYTLITQLEEEDNIGDKVVVDHES